MRKHKDRRVLFNLQLSQDRWLQISEHRTRNGGSVVVHTDVTDLVRLERAERAKLIDNQARMVRATLDHLNQAVAIFDADAQLVGWNDKVEQLLPLPARRLRLGARFDGLVDVLGDKVVFGDGMTCAALQLWAQGQTPRPSLNFPLTEISGRTLQTFAAAMPDGGFVMSFTDVTHERETARQLAQLNQKLEQRVRERTSELEIALSAAERANASKSRFVAAASHDLLQPLAAAKLFLASLEESITAQQRTVVEKASSALGAAESIIDALMNISKLDEDALQLDMRPVALDNVLAPVVAETEILAQQKGLQLRYVPSTLYVHSDPSYLRRIVQNLLGNAVRYTDHGKVVLGVRRCAGNARIEVWDTGPGIASQDQQVIFEEFRRLTPHGPGNSGLGLGLAIVERACQRLNHQIDLWSHPGQGSCFRVHAPVVQPVFAAADQTSDPKGGTPRVKRNLIVLLVENDAQMRRALTLMLETWGLNVIEADGIKSAHTLLDDLGITPDLCLFDYHLGRAKTGVDLHKQLHDPQKPVPTAIISASRDLQVLHDCAATGLTFLRKPLDQEDLRAFLSQVR
jgi:signal transduction histidine kinase